MPLDKVAHRRQEIGYHRSIDKGHQDPLHHRPGRQDLVKTKQHKKEKNTKNHAQGSRQTDVQVFFELVFFHCPSSFLYTSKPFIPLEIT